MRRIVSPILFFVYLAFTSGVLVSSHFCMNRLDSTQLFASHSDTCGKCGMHTDESDGCCRDEAKILKVEDDQQAGQVQLFAFAAPEMELPAYAIASVDDRDQPELDWHRDTGPPGYPPDLYLRNNVFRI